MAARSVGSLEAAARRACSGTLDGSDKIDVALLRSRNDDKAAEKKHYSSVAFLPISQQVYERKNSRNICFD